MHLKPIILLLVLTAFIQGCVTTTPSGAVKISLLPEGAVTNPLAPQHPSPAFKDTELYGLFAKHPYNSAIPFKQQFPRVAITVIEAPPTHNEHWVAASAFGPPKPGCWKIRATIWHDGKSSKEVEPFYWCSPDDNVKGVPLRGAQDWWLASLNKGIEESTGDRRTDGPLPPDKAVPTDLKHQKFWQNTYFNSGKMDGWMFASILYGMAFDWSFMQDRRVWLVRFDQAQ